MQPKKEKTTQYRDMVIRGKMWQKIYVQIPDREQSAQELGISRLEQCQSKFCKQRSAGPLCHIRAPPKTPEPLLSLIRSNLLLLPAESHRKFKQILLEQKRCNTKHISGLIESMCAFEIVQEGLPWELAEPGQCGECEVECLHQVPCSLSAVPGNGGKE